MRPCKDQPLHGAGALWVNCEQDMCSRWSHNSFLVVEEIKDSTVLDWDIYQGAHIAMSNVINRHGI